MRKVRPEPDLRRRLFGATVGRDLPPQRVDSTVVAFGRCRADVSSSGALGALSAFCGRPQLAGAVSCPFARAFASSSRSPLGAKGFWMKPLGMAPPSRRWTSCSL